MSKNKFSNPYNKLELLSDLTRKFQNPELHDNLVPAKISFCALLNGTLDSSMLDYSSFAPSLLKVVLSFNGGINTILESFKLDVMQGNNEAKKACYILTKVYEIGFYIQKDEYIANLLTLIGYKLGNKECIKTVDSDPTKYDICTYTANNFIQKYIGEPNITFDDAILSAACSDTLNTSILGDQHYNNMYNPG